MYKQIDANRHKSLLLMAVFTGVLAAAGYVYGDVTNTGSAGLAFALAFSIGMTSFSWFWGDKLILWTSGATHVETREQNPYLWNLVENLSITAGLPMPKVYVVDDPAPNAFATGRDPQHASVAVTSGLVQILENEELEGVLAHELSHIKNYDIRWMLLVAVMVGALGLLSDTLVHGRIFGGRRDRDREGSGLLMIAGILLLILAPLIGQLVKLAISRKREYLADASGALLTRYPEGLAKALAKIRDHSQPLARASQATASLWIANPFREQRLSNFFSTHPPIDDRIRELRKMADAR